tara:strand:+ start:1675 stop:1851 length:177 start_codon:yes stop_codon:yes gene_type:complete
MEADACQPQRENSSIMRGLREAEREGFEPPVLKIRTTAFEAAALNRTLPSLQLLVTRG